MDRQTEPWLPRWLSGKESLWQCRRHGFNPWVRKIPWRRKWQPTPVFLPGESHGQRSLVGYSSWGCRVRHCWKTELNWSVYIWVSRVTLVVKNPPLNAEVIRDTGLIPGLEWSPGGEHGSPFQCSCLENPMDRGAWQATVCRVTKSGLKQVSMHSVYICQCYSLSSSHP